MSDERHPPIEVVMRLKVDPCGLPKEQALGILTHGLEWVRHEGFEVLVEQAAIIRAEEIR